MFFELIEIYFEKDPAAKSRLEVMLCYPGFHALVLHSFAHWLWLRKRTLLARFLSHITRCLTGIEIHPGAQIGRRVFIDHGMGIVIGETTIVGDDVVIYQGVTLGTGTEGRMGQATRGKKRHPTLGRGVVVGSGAEIQGDIVVGDYARIASGSIVLKDVPPNSVVVGVPGRVIYQNGQRVVPEANDMEAQAIKSLSDRLKHLEQQLQALIIDMKRNPTLDIELTKVNGSKDDKGTFTGPKNDGNDPVEKFLHGAGI